MLYWGLSPTKERPEVPRMKCAVDLQGTKETLLLGYGVNMSVNLKERHISREALRQEPDSGGGPPGKLYVPATVQQRVLLCQPPAKDNMVILFLVDSFSKTSKFMPLPKLSSAK
ncbi:hypothetical protein AOLI_G00195720 [Acnodon oligacanthus]